MATSQVTEMDVLFEQKSKKTDETENESGSSEEREHSPKKSTDGIDLSVYDKVEIEDTTVISVANVSDDEGIDDDEDNSMLQRRKGKKEQKKEKKRLAGLIFKEEEEEGLVRHKNIAPRAMAEQQKQQGAVTDIPLPTNVQRLRWWTERCGTIIPINASLFDFIFRLGGWYGFPFLFFVFLLMWDEGRSKDFTGFISDTYTIRDIGGVFAFAFFLLFEPNILLTCRKGGFASAYSVAFHQCFLAAGHGVLGPRTLNKGTRAFLPFRSSTLTSYPLRFHESVLDCCS
jgi:hypothetical protein